MCILQLFSCSGCLFFVFFKIVAAEQTISYSLYVRNEKGKLYKLCQSYMICLIFSELQGKQLLILKMLSVLIPPCVGEAPFLWYNYGVILVQFCALLCGFLWGASV